MDFYIYLIVACVLVIILYSRTHFIQSRAHNIRAFAEENGFKYTVEDEASIRKLMTLFSLFNKGHTRRITNIICKSENNIKFILFDYSHSINFYPTASPQVRQTTAQTIILLKSSKYRLLKLDIHSKNDIIINNQDFVEYYHKCPLSEIESNGELIIIYYEQATHPVEDYRIIAKQALHIYDLLKEKT